MSAVDNILDRTFGLSAKGVTAGSEIRAGITTFLTNGIHIAGKPRNAKRGRNTIR